MAEPDVILASGSSTRRKMLEATGLSFRVCPSTVDEPALRTAMRGQPAEHIAANLARAKAEQVSGKFPAAIVIGADQLLECEGEIFAKATSAAEARLQLERLKGKIHTLPTAVVLATDGQVIWSHLERPRLAMRQFSSAFLSSYLAAHGDRVCATVGGYEIEGQGAQLFDRVDGDYFSILGLPLLPLLAQLRNSGVLRS